ncbi:unnamed protein product [Arabidopsis halleri]
MFFFRWARCKHTLCFMTLIITILNAMKQSSPKYFVLIIGN